MKLVYVFALMCKPILHITPKIVAVFLQQCKNMTLNSYTEFNQIYSFIPLRKDGSDAAMFWFTGYSDGVRSVELLMIAGPQ